MLKQIFKLTNKYIILMTPLVLFAILTSIFMAFSMSGNVLHILINIVILGLMNVAFIAGWGGMLKKAVFDIYTEDPNTLIKEFIPSVGEYFLASLLGLINVFIFFIFGLCITAYVGTHLIGDIGVSASSISSALQSSEGLRAFILSLSPEQLKLINMWNLLVITSISAMYFIVMLYFPTIFFKEKNSYKAVWTSLKLLFGKKILYNMIFFITVGITYALLSILSAITMSNAIIRVIFTMVNFYYMTFVFVSLFYYYNKYFINTHLGQNIDIQF